MTIPMHVPIRIGFFGIVDLSDNSLKSLDTPPSGWSNTGIRFRSCGAAEPGST